MVQTRMSKIGLTLTVLGIGGNSSSAHQTNNLLFFPGQKEMLSIKLSPDKAIDGGLIGYSSNSPYYIQEKYTPYYHPQYIVSSEAWWELCSHLNKEYRSLRSSITGMKTGKKS